MMVSGSAFGGHRSSNIHVSDVTLATRDMTNNGWGTADPDSIQAWIYDGNDRPEDPYFIQWDPVLPGPLPVQKKSLGGTGLAPAQVAVP